MQALHAPWRIQYILGPKSPKTEESLFSRIAASKDDIAHLVVRRGTTCFALLNAYPYGCGHLMVVPYRETADWNALNDSELLELMRMLRDCQNALTKALKPAGFNVGVNLGTAAGAGIAEHLHIHIVPRWAGDTNFMPVTASTAIIPEALAETAARIRAAF